MSRAARLVERHRGKEALSFLGRTSFSSVPRALRSEWRELEGQALQDTGDFRRAHLAYRAAFRLSRAGADNWRRADIALRLGDTARQLELFHDALRWYRAAATLARRVRSLRISHDAASGHAMSLRGLGRYADALRVFARLLAAYRASRDADGVAYVLWAMGTTERFAGRLADADRHLKQAVSAYAKLRDESGLAYARCGWGGTLRMMGHAERSRRLYEAAFKTFRREGDRFGMAYASCGQANGWRMQGKLNLALPFMARAERGYQDLRLHGPLGFVLWSRAQLFVEQGKLAAAAAELRKSESAFRRARDPRGLVYVLLGRGELARARGHSRNPHFAQAAREAARLGLALERAHARVRSGAAEIGLYRQIGASIPHFSRYRSLP